MCLIAFAIDHDRRLPLVIAANRDEFHARPAAPLAWWTPAGAATPVLGGRDLDGGGSWLALNAAGRLAMLTNVRRAAVAADPAAPSRGGIVTDWLAACEPADRFWARTAAVGHNGFNLVFADFSRGECFWASNLAPSPRRLESGVYGLSNAALDTPWPKVTGLKAQLARAVDAATASGEPVDALADRLFDALADRREADDAALPDTGVSRELERRLSAAHIHLPERGYGTRCATLVVTERIDRRFVTHVFERSFDGAGMVVGRQRMTLSDWPPTDGGDDPADRHHSARCILTCGIPTSSKGSPTAPKPARA